MSHQSHPLGPSVADTETTRLPDGRHQLRYQRTLGHSVARVWAALTEPSELVGWLADAQVELSVGGRIVLRWLNTDDQGNTAISTGTIRRLDPPWLLEYDSDIHGLLRWELQELPDGCALTFTTITPAPLEYLPLVQAGWHIHLDHLADALAGQPVEWARWSPQLRATGSGQCWQDYYDQYVG
jgi:uncharacterized protein YndB with AHSA1/START domain